MNNLPTPVMTRKEFIINIHAMRTGMELTPLYFKYTSIQSLEILHASTIKNWSVFCTNNK